MAPYASIIHAIVCESVPMSGAGMSRFTPSKWWMLVAYLPSHAVELGLAQRARVTLNAALRPAEWDVDDGRLPRHEGGEGPYFVDVGGWMKARSALVGAARRVMLDTVAVEDLDRAVVHANRYRDRQLTPGLLEQVTGPVVESQTVGGAVEELVHFVESVHGIASSWTTPGGL